MKLFPNFAPHNVELTELWPCNQRCVQHFAGGGRTTFFYHGCFYKIIIKCLYQIVRHDRFLKKSMDIVSMIPDVEILYSNLLRCTCGWEIIKDQFIRVVFCVSNCIFTLNCVNYTVNENNIPLSNLCKFIKIAHIQFFGFWLIYAWLRLCPN